MTTGADGPRTADDKCLCSERGHGLTMALVVHPDCPYHGKPGADGPRTAECPCAPDERGVIRHNRWWHEAFEEGLGADGPRTAEAVTVLRGRITGNGRATRGEAHCHEVSLKGCWVCHALDNGDRYRAALKRDMADHLRIERELRDERDRYRAALEENYPLLLDGTWYDDHDAAQERLGRIREALADERISRTLDG